LGAKTVMEVELEVLFKRFTRSKALLARGPVINPVKADKSGYPARALSSIRGEEHVPVEWKWTH